MPMPDQPPPWRIVFYKDNRGRSPITDYLNALPVAEQAAAAEAFRLLREFGVSLGTRVSDFFLLLKDFRSGRRRQPK